MMEITAEIRALIDKAAAGVELAEDEYIDPSDGLIHCKKCGGQRQTVVPCFALRGTDFVICNDHGFPINPDSYGALVRRIGQRAGIEGLHPHMFRHTFVSILLSNPEIGVATVAAEAGHAQPSTTLAIYTQVYDKRRKEIRNQMSKELYE